MGRMASAGAEVVERLTRRYGKPAFGLHSTEIDGRMVEVTERPMEVHPFCTLTRFERDVNHDDPRVLLVAPLSGHFATLVRETVASLLPEHDVYVTDWADARNVAYAAGPFGLDDYIDTMMAFIDHVGAGAHVIAVCQPAVPVLAAISLMAAQGHPATPATMTLMAGPIDTRVRPTPVMHLIQQRPLSWFELVIVDRVPAMYPGFMRRVIPGFLQLSGFLNAHLDRHVRAHMEFFNDLVRGDGDSADTHRRFYDEFLAVMDLPAEYYLETLRTVFMEHALPTGSMCWRGHLVEPQAIHDTALLTLEGQRDDISPPGQTVAAHALVSSLPDAKRAHHVQPGVGHFGIFHGRRWRQEVFPRVREFIRTHA